MVFEDWIGKLEFVKEVFMGIEHSQNYLHSKQLVATLLSKSNICNDDIVIEIGPGKGIITNELAKKARKL